MDKHHPGQQPYATLLKFVADRKGHDFRYAINNHKIQSALHWAPKETLASGIHKTMQFYLQQLKEKA